VSLSKLMSFVCDTEDKKLIDETARKCRMTSSELIRLLVFGNIDKVKETLIEGVDNLSEDDHRFEGIDRDMPVET
jgi:hypothetical protein